MQERKQSSEARPARMPGWLRRIWPDAADRARREVADRLYGALVKQARMRVFYRDLGVPDTPEGRFEMVGLHVALVVRRLGAAGAPGRAFGQALFDLMFEDLDESLRHIGIGDLAVGKQINRLAGNFYARLQALDEALATVPAAPLGPMVRNNVYHGGPAPNPRQLATLVDYLLRAEAALRAQTIETLLAGRVDLVAPVAPGERSAAVE
jgi:cytochrome b pre-mRNA-processing protein 3